jgi:hypothetical protein
VRRRRALEQILRLDPKKDHREITYRITCYEFPFDVARSLEFALFRTFASPRIGGLLDRTGEFGHRAQKRYDDTDLILNEILENGYDSERGRAALRRLNQLHGRFAIANEDFLYVLSTFVFEPIRWIGRFGYRPLVEAEQLGLFHYWREVGRRMNIQAIPDDFAAFERSNVEYERAHFRYSEANHRVAVASRDMFLSWFLPPPLRRWGEPVMYALMDDRLLEAVGFPKPPAATRRLVESVLKARARIVRRLPERRQPRLRTKIGHRTYRQGYRIEELGPKI